MNRLSLAFLVSVTAAGCTGSDGVSYLTDLADEPAGANCPGGGVKVTTGPDSNDNKTLDDSEVEQTKFVCSGGASGLTDVQPEPPGANCGAGGVVIKSGSDGNRNGTLEPSEVTSTNYVCGAGEAIITKMGAAVGVPTSGTAAITILQHTITTPAGGQILALAASDAFCTPTECPGTAPAASGYLWIADGDDMVAPVPEYDFFWLQPNTTEAMTRTAHFPITAGGAHTYHVRGQAMVPAYQYYRNEITLIYLP